MSKRLLQPILPALLLGFLLVGCNDRGEQARRSANNGNPSTASGQSASNQQSAKDDWITTSVQSKLFVDRAVKGSKIDVSTSDAVVTLKGSVPNQQAKQEAVKQAQDVNGVSRVDDQLQVAQQQAPAATSGSGNAQPANESNQQPGSQPYNGQQPQDDNAITTRIEAKYFTNPSIANRDITVESQGGMVTLKGAVQNDSERQEAVSTAKGVAGVKSVNDQLQIDSHLQPASGSSSQAPPASGSQLPIVAPAPQTGSAAIGTSGSASPETQPGASQPDDVIRTKIQSLFYENDATRNNKIAVACSNGVVTLSGTASDPAAKQQAVQIAKSVPGVHSVVDRISGQ